MLRLFHSITVDGKNAFLKKVCLTVNLGMLPKLFFVLYAALVVGILPKRYLGDWFLVILKNSKVFQATVDVLKIPNLIFDKVFP